MAHQIRHQPLSWATNYQAIPISNSAFSASLVSRNSTTSVTSSSVQETHNYDETIELVAQNDPSSSDEIVSMQKTEYASWGVHWRKPAFILAMLFASLALSLGHHFYYLSMDNQTAGDAAKQAWPTRIGTGIAFLVTSCLKAGTATALGQYIWTIIKRKAFTISSLDKLFALSTDPMGVFSLDLLQNARVALFLGLIIWSLGLASVAPPATLTIIARNISTHVYVPTLDISQPGWITNRDQWVPETVSNTIAVQSGSSFDVVPLARPISSTDWSYTIEFFGPTLQCDIANSTQQSVFDSLIQRFEDQDSLFTFTQMNDTTYNSTSSPSRLLYSAWSYWPFADGTPNFWSPGPGSGSVENPQIWIQTSASSIVCTSVNASFNVNISYAGGMQHIIPQTIQVIGDIALDPPLPVMIGGVPAYRAWSPFFTHFQALGSLLLGNLTILDDFTSLTAMVLGFTSGEADTNILTTGLMACEEIANSPFKDLPFHSAPSENVSSIFMTAFLSQPGTCRNQTLLRAIEDLANNITISYLSTPELTNDNTISRNIVTSNTYNVYQYHPLYLLISYGVALFLSSIAAIVGFYSLQSNGISHSASFSAIIATTRNPELDSLTKASSLGADPPNTDIKKTKLRFGPLLSWIGESRDKGKLDTQVTEEIPHVAFGLEDSVGQLKKGGLYI